IMFTLFTSIIVSALVAHTLLVPVAMIAGWIFGLGIGLWHKLKTSDSEYKTMSTTKIGVIDAIVAAIGSQMGWVALLI
ncbi:MAG: hypothetical protein K2G70_02590, partial [Turicibacter sp.]|nr:hypothetical protein [Turicibacter sp.]